MNKDIVKRKVRAYNGRPEESFSDRFWSNVNKNGNVVSYIGSPCWEWTGSKTPQGYGQVNAGVGVTNVRAHRLSWYLNNGEIGDFHVLHKCDNPSCVNPSHLFLGTNADNVADCVAKGRQCKTDWSAGEDNPMSKLIDSEVLEIRRLSESGIKGVAIAKITGYSTSVISSVITRTTWKHI